jgi:HAD superfamily hydrolase (TIGR01549 family)
MPKIRAVIFDMDGTLIDSKEFICRAMEAVLSAQGIAVTRDQLATVTGRPVQAMYTELAPHLDPTTLEKQHRHHHEQNMHLLAEYEGVHETLRRLLGRRLKLGIFTGFDRQTYDRLMQFDLTDYFESVIESTKYKKHKPEPEGLLLCMSGLDVKPEATIYVGDGISDILAGKAAGVTATIGITHGFGTRETLQAAGADYIIDSLGELVGVIEQIEQKAGVA